MPILLDTSRSPILRIVFEGQSTDAEMRVHLEELTRELKARPVNALIYDARRANAPSAVQRQLQAAWMKEHEGLIRVRGAGVAFVIDSALIRGALTAILWLQPMATEHTIVATVDEAHRWCEGQLRTKNARLEGTTSAR